MLRRIFPASARWLALSLALTSTGQVARAQSVDIIARTLDACLSAGKLDHFKVTEDLSKMGWEAAGFDAFDVEVKHVLKESLVELAHLNGTVGLDEAAQKALDHYQSDPPDWAAVTTLKHSDLGPSVLLVFEQADRQHCDMALSHKADLDKGFLYAIRVAGQLSDQPGMAYSNVTRNGEKLAHIYDMSVAKAITEVTNGTSEITGATGEADIRLIALDKSQYRMPNGHFHPIRATLLIRYKPE